MMRITSPLDRFITEIDYALRTVIPPQKRVVQRQTPAHNIKEHPLSSSEKKHIAGLMRVNHTAKKAQIKQQMAQAAAEETDHLAWCEERLASLGSKPSLLNPLWYLGSLFLGAVAGLAGDKISLGFVVETERQVTEHLQHHLHQIPAEDLRTKLILKQMQEDEEHHAQIAQKAGAIELPYIIKQLMGVVSKLMTKSSYYV